MDDRIVKGQVVTQDPTTQVWLLNEGIACNEAKAMVTITFAELRQELIDMREVGRFIVQDLPRVIHEHGQSSREKPPVQPFGSA